VPVLAEVVPDRASLDSPTAEASAALAVAAPIAPRVKPAPFLRLSLPDPFENAQAVRLRVPPAEEPAPPGLPSGPPRR
jgi:hypothetical protein